MKNKILQIVTVIVFLFITNMNYAQVVNLTDSCMAPTTDTVTSITGKRAIISWSGYVYSLAYGIRIRVVGSDTWTHYSVYAPRLSKIISGLSALTTYEYQVKSFCLTTAVVSTNYTPIKYFTTLCNCAVPTALNFTAITTTTATSNWTGNDCAMKYRLQYRANGTIAWIQKTINAPSLSKLITALSANTVYEYRLRSDGNSNGSIHSEWSSIHTFSTTLRTEDVTLNSHGNILNIFPNPSGGKFSITFNSTSNENATLYIIDVIGNEVLREKLLLNEGDNAVNVALTDLSDGIYLVKLESPEAVITKKLTIKK